MTRTCVNLKEHCRRPSCPQEAVLAHPERPVPPWGQLPNTKIEQGLHAVWEQHSEAGPSREWSVSTRENRGPWDRRDRFGPLGDIGEKS